MIRNFISCALFGFSYCAIGQNCPCDSIFTQVKACVEDNYAGWFDKVNQGNNAIYKNWTDRSFEKSKLISNDSLCFVHLQEWISFFHDNHLALRYNSPKTVNNSEPGVNEPVTIFQTQRSEAEIMDYLKKMKGLDEIEGIYESSSYKLGIIRERNNIFYATIISTSNENWNPGEVKLIIEKKGRTYTGWFFEGDKSDKTTHPVRIVDNILDFEIVFYNKTFPVPKKTRDIRLYEIEQDKQAPKLTFPEADLALFSFPNFYGDSYEQLEYLLSQNEEKLQKTPYWIVDLRNNVGGDYSVGLQLLKYIYTRPILNFKSEMRMTEANFNMWYNNYVRYTYENADTTTQKEYDASFKEMKANYGKMHRFNANNIDTLYLDNKLSYPQKVGILIDSNTVSSGELFTMVARQSDKVTVFGTHSGGMMDYGNVVTYKTSCKSIRLRLPMNRQLWLDTGFSVDAAGLQPDVYLKGKNWIDKTYKSLKK